jgi:hypothetical protein
MKADTGLPVCQSPVTQTEIDAQLLYRRLRVSDGESDALKQNWLDRLSQLYVMKMKMM